MELLGILPSHVSKLHRDIDSLIITPRMLAASDGNIARITASKTELQSSGKHKDTTAIEVIDDVYSITNFLDQALPTSISSPLLNKMLPSLILQLVSAWLDPSMPLKLDNLEPFQAITKKVEELAKFIENSQVDMPSDADLQAWLKRVPQNWLARRKEAALADMRSSLYQSVKIKKTAEKTETQVVQNNDVMFGGNGVEEDGQEEDDWGENWGS